MNKSLKNHNRNIVDGASPPPPSATNYNNNNNSNSQFIQANNNNNNQVRSREDIRRIHNDIQLRSSLYTNNKPKNRRRKYPSRRDYMPYPPMPKKSELKRRERGFNTAISIREVGNLFGEVPPLSYNVLPEFNKNYPIEDYNLTPAQKRYINQIIPPQRRRSSKFTRIHNIPTDDDDKNNNRPASAISPKVNTESNTRIYNKKNQRPQSASSGLNKKESNMDWKYTTLWYGRRETIDNSDWISLSPLKKQSIIIIYLSK